ncbi:MAG: hypothetical protein HY820_24335 [Acidobacteria bacterium]|nr:hypothetical protein [Acidobacteriota bacterium]
MSKWRSGGVGKWKNGGAAASWGAFEGARLTGRCGQEPVSAMRTVRMEAAGGTVEPADAAAEELFGMRAPPV